jgi:hypothetical protein
MDSMYDWVIGLDGNLVPRAEANKIPAWMPSRARQRSMVRMIARTAQQLVGDDASGDRLSTPAQGQALSPGQVLGQFQTPAIGQSQTPSTGPGASGRALM